ncbi:MAG: TIGR04442 family protein [Nitrospirae bacterium]|nr:TIGR04442 family protein [Nitrospirota bacterium]
MIVVSIEYFTGIWYIFIMIRDLRLHGNVGPVEFFALVGGASVESTYFYEETASSIRFFSKGNEFTITKEGIHYKGTGGSFCEYMFGVEKPLKDMIKGKISNRLIMFGAFLNEKEKIVFTNDTEGSESYYRLFLQGNAVKNYCFFVSSELRGEHKKRQQQILGSVGKFLKRTDFVSKDNDTELINNFISELNEQKSTVFIFKIIHRANEEFYRAFEGFYAHERKLTSQEDLFLEDIVAKYMIDSYQRERMKIDVMYKHPENRRVVDEYRDILLNAISKESLEHSDAARLRRLKTLGIRNNIPSILFDTLDDLLLRGKKLQEVKEPEYLKEARSILENLFFKDPSLKKHIINEDIVRLIKAKHRAHSQSDMGFEQLLLDTGRACDEIARETNDFSIFEEFSSIVTYFDRYNNVQTVLSQMAFMENVDFSEDSLRSLIGNKNEFDKLDTEFFGEIFIKDLLNNKYITAFGRRKINAISKGIAKIYEGDSSLRDVVTELKIIRDEERLYYHVHGVLKERMRSFYPRLNTKEGKAEIKKDIEQELIEEGFARRVPQKLFEKALIDLKKESFYLNHLLPVIIDKKDTNLREDFLKNSGLDRFYIETIEKEYLESKGFDFGVIEQIRESKELSSIVN